jgi:elongation factor Ts
MKVSLEAIRTLREQTNASLNDVRKALESSGGDPAKAREWLRQRGAQIAATRQGRSATQGRVEAYLHHDGRVAAVVEVNCETDFVARTPDFQQFCRDVAMQVAAMGSDNLLAQPCIKDQGATVQDLLKALIAKTGENIVIRRSARFAVGEAVEGGA